MAHVEKISQTSRIFTTSVTAQGVTPNTHAVASLSEMARSNPAGPLDMAILGNATMKVYNVSPGLNEVWVRGEVDWDTDLDIRITVLMEGA